MTFKKSLLALGAATTIGLAGFAGASTVSAATSGSDQVSLIEKISQKFSLNENEVQAVFDGHKDEIHAAHQAKIEARLDEAVDNGDLTEAQKEMLLAKLAELRAEREELQGSFEEMSRDERKAAMEQHRDELEQWAEVNDIPTEFLRFGGQGHGHAKHRF